jgi:hypothetical protein
MATNNLDEVYLENSLSGFETILCDVSAFSKTIAEEQATYGDTLTVPYMTHTSASQAFSYSTGYQSDQTSIVGKDVVLNQLLYRVGNVPDNAASKLSGTNLEEMFRGMGEALARDVISQSFVQVLSESNFPTSASITQTNLTSSIGLSNLVFQVDTLNWTTNRSLIVAPSAFQYVLQNPDVNKSYAFGSSDPVQKGVINNVFGFSVNKYSGVFPVVAQPAKGIACDSSAILLGFGIHTPGEASRGLVRTTQGKSKGVLLQMRTFYNSSLATTQYVLEACFGVGVGNSTGLVWLK